MDVDLVITLVQHRPAAAEEDCQPLLVSHSRLLHVNDLAEPVGPGAPGREQTTGNG
jgi:hypothetical protein